MTMVLLLLFFLLGCTVGCSQHYSAPELIAYVDAHPERFCTTIKRNGIEALICYRPAAYHIAREKIHFPEKKIAELLDKYGNSVVYLITLRDSKEPKRSVLLDDGGILKHPENVTQTSFGLSNNAFILADQDTLLPSNYQYETNWHLGTGDVLIYSFDGMVLGKASSQRLILRDLSPLLGTIDINLKKITKPIYLKD